MKRLIRSGVLATIFGWIGLVAVPCMGVGPGPLNNGGWIPPDAATKRCESKALGIAAKLLNCIVGCRKKAAASLLAGHAFDEKGCVEGPSPMSTSCFEKYDAATAALTAQAGCATANQCLDPIGLRGSIQAVAAPVLAGTYCSGACGTANLPCCSYPQPATCSTAALTCVNCSNSPSLPNSTCLACGGELQPCCANATCNAGLPCELAPLCSGQPVPTCRCGFQGDPCCTSAGNPPCFLSYTCSAGTCQ